MDSDFPLNSFLNTLTCWTFTIHIVTIQHYTHLNLIIIILSLAMVYMWKWNRTNLCTFTNHYFHYFYDSYWLGEVTSVPKPEVNLEVSWFISWIPLKEEYLKNQNRLWFFYIRDNDPDINVLHIYNEQSGDLENLPWICLVWGKKIWNKSMVWIWHAYKNH